jgi:hypothetical protein
MRAAVSDTKLKLVKSGIGEAIPVPPYPGGVGHISPLRTIIACAILTAEKLLENTSGTNMAN